jgi:Zinc carboxypeptidase/Secretion system C-terminal sorting domain
MRKLFLFLLSCLSANLFAQEQVLEKHIYLPKANRTTHTFGNQTLIGDYARVKVSGINIAAIAELLEKGVALDHLEWLDSEKTTFAAELSAADIALIATQKNAVISVLVDDLGYHYAHQNDAVTGKNNPINTVNALPTGFNLGSMGGYLTFDEYVLELDSLAAMYPALVSPKFSIGTTIEGRNIWALKISDNVATDEAEPEVLIDGLIHAREGVAGMQSMYFIHDLLQKYMQNDPEARFLVNNRELFIIPVINPDGYEYNRSIEPDGGGMWRKNRRDNGDGTMGVDLNRNFGYFWGVSNNGSSPNTASDLYRGTAGFSEPETQAIRNFANQRQFKTVLNHHTFSNLMIRPFAYNEAATCIDEQAFVEYGPVLTEQNGFLYGKASQTVGYNVNGSTDDWMYGEANTKPRIISFTPETGSVDDGFWPPLERIIPLCQTVEDANFKIVWLAGEYFQGYGDPHNIYSFTGFIPYWLRNLGQSTSLPVSIKYVSSSPYILPNQPIKNIGAVGSLQNANDSLQVNIAPNTPNNTYITGEIQVSFGGYNYMMEADFLFFRPLGTTTANTPNFSVFPNPAHDVLTIKSEQNTEKIARVKVSDVLGRQISTQTLTNNDIDTKNLIEGVYFLSLYNAKNDFLGSVKFVKK